MTTPAAGRMISSVKMTTRGVSVLILVGTLVAVIDGFDVRGRALEGAPTAEDCMRPPFKKIGRECCRPPKEKIWGDLKGSFHMCFRKYRDSKQEPELMRQEAGDPDLLSPDAPDMSSSSTEDPGAVPVPPEAMDPSSSTPPGFPNQRRRPHWRKPFSERVKDVFSKFYKDIKNTFDALWQSVVIITDHFRRNINDSCFMECVFEDQGFLTNKQLNKDALLMRLSDTLGSNEPWHKAAVQAFEGCYNGLQVPPSSSCKSGSEEVFRCTFKQLFLNCPNWAQNEYCNSLKEFYQKCPNGPPPEPVDSHTVSPSEEATEIPVTTES